MTIQEKMDFVEQWINRNTSGKNARLAYRIWKETAFAPGYVYERWYDYLKSNNY